MNIRKELKKNFEANMLDGDKVEDCGKAMLSAQHVWEYIESSALSLFTQRFEEIIGKIKPCINHNLGGSYVHGYKTGHSDALSDVLEALKRLK